MKEIEKYHSKGIYIGDEFPEEYGNEVLIADDDDESGYIIKFPDGSTYDNMHDEDIQFINSETLKQETNH